MTAAAGKETAPPAADPSAPVVVVPAVVPLPAIVPTPANVDDLVWDSLAGEDSGDLVVNAEKGYVYTWLRPADYPPDGRQIQHERQKYVTRGWEPRNGPLCKNPGPEYVTNRPELEIWRVSQARYDNEWRADMARSVLDRRYADRYYRWTEKGNKKPGLPAGIVSAMYAFHGLMVIPGKPVPPTREQLIAMVRRMPVHPGVESVSDAW